MNRPVTLTPRLLAVAIGTALVVSGCTTPTRGLVGEHARYQSTTLGDLERVDIPVQAQDLENPSAENALESYRRAIDLFQDPETRARYLRRMADLALAAAERKTRLPAGETVAANVAEQPAVGDEELDREVDRLLYENFMEKAQTTADREERYAQLDLASNMKSALGDARLETDYSTAIMLYQTLLETSEDPVERAETWYLIAKSWSLAGEPERALAALDRLVQEHPDSVWYVEAQFRRGEMLFSDGDFEYAAAAYREVVRAGIDTEFFDQARYKLGWSEYKLGAWPRALDTFVGLADALHGHPDLADERTMRAKLHADTLRAIALAFSNMGSAATAATEWFARHGQRPYELDVYRTLGGIYRQQERFRDAAETYEAWAINHPASPAAPELSSLSIQAWQDGGFPSEIIPAKERFVTRYGVHGEYWAGNPELRESYVSLLKSHLLDLAKFHHAGAQRGRDRTRYLTAARWYEEYLATPPAGPENVDINNLLAQALFAAGDFAAAVTQFERTAYDYPLPALPAEATLTPAERREREDAEAMRAEAAYFALVAYQRHIAALPAPAAAAAADGAEAVADARVEWRARRIASSLRFARAWPQHARVPEVLDSVIDDQLANGDKAGAVETAGLLVHRQPPPPEKMLVRGWATIGNGEFDLGRYRVAEYAYDKVLQFRSLTAQERTLYLDRLAAAVYRQAEELRDRGDTAGAAATFLRVGAVHPHASIRRNAEFDAATLYLQLDDHARAIPILVAFRQRWPDDPLNETVPDKLAVAYEKVGNYGAAAAELETIADRYAADPAQRELARQALWQAAEMQDRANDPAASIRLYRKYAHAHAQPFEFRAEAQYRLAGFYRQLGNEDNRTFWLKQLAGTLADAGDEASDRVAWLGAWAAFELAEPAWERFAAIRLTQPLKRSLTAKTRAMNDALQRYQQVADIGVSEFATAANFRIGQMYRRLAQDMLESERPRGLDELEREQYDLLLEEQALPYEDQAIDMLIANADLVAEGIYDTWVKQSFAALAELLPGRYAKSEQVEDYVDIIY